MICNEKIYDITTYKKYHPGGLDKIMMGAGKDATSLICNHIKYSFIIFFTITLFLVKYHPWVNVHNILEKYQVGIVIKKK